MKLFILYLAFLTSVNGFICNLCPKRDNIIYVNHTPCFEFGDCIDKGQDDNTFWSSQLDSYLRESTSHLSTAFRTIERKISKYDDGNFTIFEGTPKPMCMPSQELSENDAFIRKMHGAYRLSELARKCKIMTMDIIAQVLARLSTISESLDTKKSDVENECANRLDQYKRGLNSSIDYSDYSDVHNHDEEDDHTESNDDYIWYTNSLYF